MHFQGRSYELFLASFHNKGSDIKRNNFPIGSHSICPRSFNWQAECGMLITINFDIMRFKKISISTSTTLFSLKKIRKQKKVKKNRNALIYPYQIQIIRLKICSTNAAFSQIIFVIFNSLLKGVCLKFYLWPNKSDRNNSKIKKNHMAVICMVCFL